MKKHYKVIVLVFASENKPLFQFFKRGWLTFDKLNPDVKVFYCYGAGSGLGKDPWDLCFEEFPESHLGGIKKILSGMEVINRDYTCDYFVHTNLSTFWDFESLIKRLDLLPKRPFVTATTAISNKKNTPLKNRRYAYGFDMVFSGEMLPKLVEKKQEIFAFEDHPLRKNIIAGYFAEDIVLSFYLTDILKCKMISAMKNCGFFNDVDISHHDQKGIDEVIDTAKEKGIDHFRVRCLQKAKYHKKRIGVDDEIFRKLCLKYYNKKIPYNIF